MSNSITRKRPLEDNYAEDRARLRMELEDPDRFFQLFQATVQRLILTSTDKNFFSSVEQLSIVDARPEIKSVNLKAHLTLNCTRKKIERIRRCCLTAFSKERLFVQLSIKGFDFSELGYIKPLKLILSNAGMSLRHPNIQSGRYELDLLIDFYLDMFTKCDPFSRGCDVQCGNFSLSEIDLRCIGGDYLCQILERAPIEGGKKIISAESWEGFEEFIHSLYGKKVWSHGSEEELKIQKVWVSNWALKLEVPWMIIWLTGSGEINEQGELILYRQSRGLPDDSLLKRFYENHRKETLCKSYLFGKLGTLEDLKEQRIPHELIRKEMIEKGLCRLYQDRNERTCQWKIGGEYVHEGLLSLISPYFSGLMCSSFCESEKKLIPLSGFEWFEPYFVRWIYTGFLPEGEISNEELFKAGHQLMIDPLRQLALSRMRWDLPAKETLDELIRTYGDQINCKEKRELDTLLWRALTEESS